MSGYNGEDMIGDDGYGTWDADRLDKEYRKLRAENKRLRGQLRRAKEQYDNDCPSTGSGEMCKAMNQDCPVCWNTYIERGE